MYMLSIVRVDESGVESPVDVDAFVRRAGLERWARLAQRLAATEPGTKRDTQGRALLALWQRSEPATAGGDRYRLYLETHGTEAGNRARNPVATRLLADTAESVVSRADLFGLDREHAVTVLGRSVGSRACACVVRARVSDSNWRTFANRRAPSGPVRNRMAFKRSRVRLPSAPLSIRCAGPAVRETGPIPLFPGDRGHGQLSASRSESASAPTLRAPSAIAAARAGGMILRALCVCVRARTTSI